MSAVRRIRSRTKRLLKRLYRPEAVDSKASYSQCGEDRIIAFLFQKLQIPRPTYLDLGANEPVALSNTYLFYRHGSRGVCVEADPALCRKFRRKRPRDVCLNVAVAAESGAAMLLHVFERSASGLTTLSQEWAEHGQKAGGYQIKSTVSVPTVGINDLLRENFPSPPNLLSVDIEGLDLAVLERIDLRSCRPDVICAETFVPFAPETGFKDVGISERLHSQGYRVFADTWINTIYVPEEKFPAL